MMQKGIPAKYVPTADEIFEMSKPEKIWLMFKQIFEIFAIYDAQLLKKEILAWVVHIFNKYNPYKEPIVAAKLKT